MDGLCRPSIVLSRDYADVPDDITDDMPIWVSFSQRNHSQAISTQTIVDICQKYLGVSTVGASRRLFLPKGASASQALERSNHNAR